MAVTSSYTLLVGSTVYDLRKASVWWDTSPQTAPASVSVKFIDCPDAVVLITKTSFETAMQTCLNAGG